LFIQPTSETLYAIIGRRNASLNLRPDPSIVPQNWKPWNKIVISIPPNGYLNENEDIAYYLDDVKLEKDFFLRGR
jgi:hypothetical protein